VYVQSPATGDGTVLVRGFNVPNGPQPFALVVDGSFGTAAPPPPPSIPDGLFANAISATRVDLSWTDSTNEDRFDVERCAGTGCSSFAKIGQSSANVLTYSDTSAVAATTYRYRIQAVNTGGVSGYSIIATATTPATPQLHVADLDRSTATSKNSWSASVTITIRDANSALVSSATVSGTWSGGFSGSASCNTAGGVCTVTSGNLAKSKTSVTFTVTNVTASGATYVPASNGDPDGDSNGTTITVLKP
jgi:hypothetical protein